MGILDQKITARMLNRYPQLYYYGRMNLLFSVRKFWQWTLDAIVHSLV